MNENDINVLLDYFVGGLDSTESANVTQNINSHPLWSKTYNQLSRVFSSLDTIKKQNSEQLAPAGLASKTFQKILEQENAKQDNPIYIAQKDTAKQTIQPNSRKRFTSVKPSFLALSACTGFLLVFVLAFVTFNFNNPSVNNHNNALVNTQSLSNHSNGTPTDAEFCGNFAVTGARQPSSSFFFCANNAPNESTPASYSNNNNFTIDSSELPGNLVPSPISAISEQKDRMIKMACPDNVVVLSSQPNEQPIVVVPQRHFPNELQNVQDVFNQSNANFVVPVNYK